MQCDSASELLDAYLDGELTAEKFADVRAHLLSCTHCSSQIAETARMQRALRSARGHFAPSPEFRRKVQKQCAQSRRPSWGFPGVPLAVAFVCIVVLVSFWMARWRRSDEFIELADLHVNALASTNQVDVVSTDRHTVKPWFQGKIPFSFNLPELTGTEFSLVGGRMVYFHQHPGAQLLVSLRQHKLSVLIFQETAEMAQEFPISMRVDDRTSFGEETWQSRGLRFVVVSDADRAGIDAIAHLFRKANE